MTTAYFDCFSGASGDMILGALLDVGADLEALRRNLAGLSIEGCTLAAEKVTKQGLAATQVTVAGPAGGDAPHRSFGTIRQIIENADLSQRVKGQAVAVFQRLAEAEATVHRCPVEKVHFHEVGAVDAIADIVGAVAALEGLGVERVICSPIPTGSGTVTCAHGVLPVPAPATADLLRGVPLAECDELGELITPTGAALLTTLAESFGPLPAMTIERIGYGAGRRQGRARPNVLRVLLGKPAAGGDADEIAVLEANLDDVSPEVVGHCLERLLAAGALDAYVVPIYMKKSRPAMLLTVLAETSGVAELEALVFAETTTLGIRRQTARRSKLSRRIDRVDTRFGPIRVKVGQRGSEVITIAPEYDDCDQATRRHHVALRVVMDEARRVWHDQSGETG